MDGECAFQRLVFTSRIPYIYVTEGCERRNFTPAKKLEAVLEGT